MKKGIKISIILFSIFLFLSSFSFVAAVSFEPQVSIPGSDQFKENGSVSVDGTTLPNYIKDIYTYAISIVGIVAAIGLMFGGFTWLTAGGSGDKVGKARDVIFGSLTGLVLALTSYTILNMINPNLVQFDSVNIGTADYGDSGIFCDSSKSGSLERGASGQCEGVNVCFQNRCMSESKAESLGKSSLMGCCQIDTNEGEEGNRWFDQCRGYISKFKCTQLGQDNNWSVSFNIGDNKCKSVNGGLYECDFDSRVNEESFVNQCGTIYGECSNPDKFICVEGQCVERSSYQKPGDPAGCCTFLNLDKEIVKCLDKVESGCDNSVHKKFIKYKKCSEVEGC